MLNTGPAPSERGGPYAPRLMSFSTVPSQENNNAFNEGHKRVLGCTMPDAVDEQTPSSDNEDVGRFQAIADYSKKRMRVALSLIHI